MRLAGQDSVDGLYCQRCGDGVDVLAVGGDAALCGSGADYYVHYEGLVRPTLVSTAYGLRGVLAGQVLGGSTVM